MRMPADHLAIDAFDHVVEIEPALLGRQLRMIDDLKEEVAKLLAQIHRVGAFDRVGNLVCLFDRIGGDGREVLFKVPGATAVGVAKRPHDFDEARNVA